MIKIITTKRYKSMEFNMELGDLLLELAEKVMRRQEIKIEELEEKIKGLEKFHNLTDLIDKKIYKVPFKKIPKEPKRTWAGVAFKGTKKELDKFIKRNSTKKARKEHEKHHKA